MKTWNKYMIVVGILINWGLFNFAIALSSIPMGVVMAGLFVMGVSLFSPEIIDFLEGDGS